MGKAQSKRSVDITTDPKKDGTVDEGTGEMKKIEDVDQLKPQVNGDTHHKENEDKEKVTENGETENEKDSSTEKENQKPEDSATASADTGAGGDVTTSTANTDSNATEQKSAEGEQATSEANETLNDSKAADSTSAETPESSKKPKKEKVKKKWSFRSISFGKKDKQKPSKKEDSATAAAAANNSSVNGECEKVPEETTTEETKNTEENKDASASATEETAAAAPIEEIKTEENNKAASTSVEELEVKVEKLESPTVITTTTTTTEEVLTNGSDKEIKTVVVETVKTSEETSTTTTSSVVIEEKEQKTETVEMVVAASNEKPAVVVEAEKPQEETKSSASLTNGIEHHDAEEPKLNGSDESPKIEVKSDESAYIVDDEQISDTERKENEKTYLSSEIEKSINNVQMSALISNIVSKDDDNDTLNPVNILSSSPPPPLPCSPPPSQVMVFALSESKQDQPSTMLDELVTVDEKVMNLRESVIAVENVAEKIDISLENVIVNNDTKVIKNDEQNGNSNEIEDGETISIDEKLKKVEGAEEIRTKTEIETDLVEKPSSDAIVKTELDEESIAKKHNIEKPETENKETLNDQQSLEFTVESPSLEHEQQHQTKLLEIEKLNEIENNATSPAKAIELAATETQCYPQMEVKLNEREGNLEASNGPNNEVIEQKDTMSTAMFDNNINEIVENIEITSITLPNTDITALKSFEENDINENKIEATNTSTDKDISEKNSQEEKQNNNPEIEQNLPTPPPTPSSPETSSLTDIDLPLDNNRERSEEITKTEPLTPIPTSPQNEIEGIKSETRTENSDDQSEESASEMTVSTSQTENNNDGSIPPPLTQPLTDNEKKENGVEHNHDQLAEVSGTESLNGADHKTIEEIKSENQQIEKVTGAEITTQETVVAE